MKKYRLILIDTLILFLVSSVLAFLVITAVARLKGKVKGDDPIVTAIIQGDIKEVRKLVRGGSKVTNETDDYGRSALMRAAYVNLADPKPLGPKERALADALARCGVRLETGSGPAPLSKQERLLMALLSQRGIRVRAEASDKAPLRKEERALAQALALHGVPVGGAPDAAPASAGRRLAEALWRCGIDVSDEMAGMPSFNVAGAYGKALVRACVPLRGRPDFPCSGDTATRSPAGFARLAAPDVRNRRPVVAFDPDKVLCDLLNECDIHLSGEADAGAPRRNVKALATELAKWNVKLGNSLTETDETRLEIVALLLSHGAALDTVDNDGWTALMWASWSGLTKVAEKLLASGASPSFADHQGNTALIIAAQRGNADIVKALLAKGANKAAANKAGKTALEAAKIGIAQYPDKAPGYNAILAQLR